MKPLLLVLFILLPILTMGQDNDVIAIFKGDTIYIGPTPILDLDLTCQHCINEYQQGIKKETIRYTLTLKTNEIIIQKAGKILDEVYIIYNKNLLYFYTIDSISGSKYRFNFTRLGDYWYTNRIGNKGIIVTYKTKTQKL